MPLKSNISLSQKHKNQRRGSYPSDTRNHLKIVHASTYYGKHLVIKDINMQVSPGEVVTIVGPSGSGKTTLLKAVAGLERVHTGSILINQKAVSTPHYMLPPSERGVAMVFQDHALFPHMNVMKNIIFPLQKGAHRRKIDRNVSKDLEKIVDYLQLSKLVKKYPHQLSGGQRQRVSLARAFLAAPEILLLDEPFASQDPEIKIQLKDTMQQLIHEKGITTLMVTHDQNEALSLADRMGVLNHGVLEQFDTPRKIYHEPSSSFIASFIGNGVFIDAIIENGMLICEFARLKNFHFSHDIVPSGKTTDVSIFLRPDDVSIVRQSSIMASIVSRMFHGASYLYRLRLDSGSEVLSIMPGRMPYEIGKRVGVSIELSRVKAFSRR